MNFIDPNFVCPNFTNFIYEDESLLILNKDSGIPSVPLRDTESGTAVHLALSRCPELTQVGIKPLEPGILHRLDTGTSGLLVFAKTQSEFERLRSAWKSGAVKKFYRALVKPVLPPPESPIRIEFPLAHHAKSSKKMIALKPSLMRKYRGKPLRAITHILHVKQRPDALFDFEIQIETGVMHQIRCHLSSMGWPILGDSLYHGSPSDRLWLHAWRLELPLKTGTTLVLEALLHSKIGKIIL